MRYPVHSARFRSLARFATTWATTWAFVWATILTPLSPARAQSDSAWEGSQANPRTSYEYGLRAGTFLPSRIRGARELVPGWGPHFALPTAKGVFETFAYFGNAHGTTYQSAGLAYRYDLQYDPLSAHVLIGLHIDRYQTPRQGDIAGGWHYGGGIAQHIAGPLSLRTDFRYRFSPGNSLEVTVGFILRVPSEATQ